MEYIRVTKENLEQEYICCAISSNKDIQASSKKQWLSGRLEEGPVFLKSVERGKCFIEYIPAQNAPTPVTNYALFFDGEYVSNEILSDKKFLKMIEG